MNEETYRNQILSLDLAHLWHPFTPQSVYAEDDPLIIAAAEGNYLIDLDGKRYLDAVASLWCAVFGHRVAEIDRAIQEQLNRIAHGTLLGNTTVPAVQLAKKLADMAPTGLKKVFFSDNGSTAVEVAVKMAIQYQQQCEGGKNRRRKKILALENAYHGDTIGAVSVGGIELFHSRFAPLLFDVVRAPVPDPYRPPQDMNHLKHLEFCIHKLEQLFASHAHELAAAVAEPRMQGAAGMILYPKEYFQRLAALCKQYGVLLIVDEVAMGMGRSGRLFACQREGVSPDIVCIAKGLSGGYLPIAATLTTQNVYEAFLGQPEEGKTFFHGHTFTGNALGCAAALATLELFEEEGFFLNLSEKIQHLENQLEKLHAIGAVGSIRQYGMAVGVELVRDKLKKTSFPKNLRMGARVCRRAREKGVFLRPLGDVIVLMPPLSITLDEIGMLIDAIHWAVVQEISD